MRTLSTQEVSTVSGGALIVGKNFNLGLSNGSGAQTSVVGRLLGNTGLSLSTDKLVYLGRSNSSCGCATPV